MVDRLQDNALGGEIEIERFPTRMIEARSKDLVPVFDYLQTPKFQTARCNEVLSVHFFSNGVNCSFFCTWLFYSLHS